MQHVFVLAGASSRTDRLRGGVELDEKGFILTGGDLETIRVRPHNPRWHLKFSLQTLETNLPGVFAAGDVRAGSVRRVASDVGRVHFHSYGPHGTCPSRRPCGL